MSRFAVHLETHRPEWGSSLHGDIRVSHLLENSTPGADRLDDVRVASIAPGLLRIAVCDPALCFTDAYPIGREAGQGALEAIMNAESLLDGMLLANQRLYRPGASRSTRMALSCIAAVDWDTVTNQVTAVRAGDCQVLVRTEQGWVDLFTSGILTEKAAQAWGNAADQRDRQAHMADHDRILGNEGAWVTAPLGQFAQPIIQHAALTVALAVAVGSDGLKLDEQVLGNLRSAWVRIHDRGDDWPHEQPHGDLAVVLAERV